ncbi:PREDICTED: putative UDP-glucuronate:xylan alpha-glucuronosyltransferase 4 [Theobroma cacao]|uniref:Hexosyltransferase n=1 Tax=Theobroma cacao TaxID=3641 RepID=A0AB32V6I6_THECC|nr:PREDICTED: putative UDP-glucuronate:xylan alpha-glucuronosyltransferase 4 [Theobroma cacao]
MAVQSRSDYPKLFTLSLILLPSSLMILVVFFGSKYDISDTVKQAQTDSQVFTYPRWFDLVREEIDGKKIKVGLVNFDDEEPAYKMHGSVVSTVHVRFDHVSKAIKWGDFFPEWIDEDQKFSLPLCPAIPMPRLEDYRDLDVVVARVPCDGWTGKSGLRDVFRLQVNLVVANLLVESGWVMEPDVKRVVYAVFVGSCGPMPEIFRCDDLLRKAGDHWVYKPELRRLKQKVLMPLGSCQIAQPYAKTGKEVWRYYLSEDKVKKQEYSVFHQKEAYVTILHSSEAYVCGAIALAQSIILSNSTRDPFFNLLSNSTRDLLLLHDENISPKSLTGLRAAGWKTRQIERIRSPFAKKGSYNEWNYSKLRIWLLTWYDKVIFIDADILVLKNMDGLFVYPPLSAAGNYDKTLFNSGIMVVEPSLCMFEDLMMKSFEVGSHNGGDQGFLNEVFTWWHRLPSKVNFLKIFQRNGSRQNIPDDLSAIHYLGLKPWMCYRDYDCNWDVKEKQIFASDKAHEKWWQVYDAMPENLQQYCGLTENMDCTIKKWRKIARYLRLPDEHWRIDVKDPRQYNLVQ